MEELTRQLSEQPSTQIKIDVEGLATEEKEAGFPDLVEGLRLAPVPGASSPDSTEYSGPQDAANTVKDSPTDVTAES